ncbi:MAG: hypothetical protein WCA19_26085, partial [Candidatus Acidiferrales bacterium]
IDVTHFTIAIGGISTGRFARRATLPAGCNCNKRNILRPRAVMLKQNFSSLAARSTIGLSIQAICFQWE